MSKQSEMIATLKGDFIAFLYVLWAALNLPEPTKCQVDMAKELAYGGKRRFILQAFRGIGKSFITCAFVVWKLWNNPQLKIMIVSASQSRADANSIFIKRIIDLLPFLHELKPRENQRNSVILFDVGPAHADHAPSVKSIGITGQMTGSRADLIIADDVEVPSNSATQMQRDKLLSLVQEFSSIIKPDGEDTIIYLGTPQCEMTLYRTLEEYSFETLVWPARYPRDEADLLSYGKRLAPMIVRELEEMACWNAPTEPQRFDEDVIFEKEIEHGRAGFALQFQLNPTLSDASKYPLKLRDLITCPLDMESAALSYQWLPNDQNKIDALPTFGLKGDKYHRYHSASTSVSPYNQRILVVDPSGRGKDETAYAVIYALNGYMYLMDVGGMRGGYEDTTLEKLARVAKRWGVHQVVVESNWADGMYNKVLYPVLTKIHNCEIVEYRSKGQKEVRIADTLEPVMSSHRLVVREEAIQADYNSARDSDGKQDVKYSAFYQMARLTKDRGSLAHDDRLDAIAIGVDHLKEIMEVNSKVNESHIEADWLHDQMTRETKQRNEIRLSFGMTITYEEDEDDYGNFFN